MIDSHECPHFLVFFFFKKNEKRKKNEDATPE